jgi:hypothetical protein
MPYILWHVNSLLGNTHVRRQKLYNNNGNLFSVQPVPRRYMQDS